MGARLLIVDDEPTLLALLRRYLERLGYEVDTAASSRDALARFSREPAGYGMVIADLTLAGMNGEEMIGRMRAANPKLRALIASGYPYEPSLANVGFLQKPFLPDMLAEAVKKALK